MTDSSGCLGCSEPNRCGNDCPDVNHGPVWVDVIDMPTMPPYGSPERAEVDRLAALVGMVCPACKSEILQRPDGEVFCWDVYCGQQLDAYRTVTR
jgi:hypothetical protein